MTKGQRPNNGINKPKKGEEGEGPNRINKISQIGEKCGRVREREKEKPISIIIDGRYPKRDWK